MSGSCVLVTGGEGFIAGHVLLQLLDSGYQVKASLLCAKNADKVRSKIKRHLKDAASLHQLSFVEADLTADSGWAEACQGCKYVLHIAGVVPSTPVGHIDELLVPAREGTLRVLRAAKRAGVQRVVLTSSVAACGWGHPLQAGDSKVYTEASWSNPDAPEHLINPYQKTKTLAELAAWDWVAQEGGLELVSVLPSVVLGPLLSKDVPASAQLICSMLDGNMALIPNLSVGIVDVRDAAALHLLALESKEAHGHRFCCTCPGVMSLREMAEVMRAAEGQLEEIHRHKVPCRRIPDALVRMGSWFSGFLRVLSNDLSIAREFSPNKAHDMLGWSTRSPEEAVIACARSLVEHKVIPPQA
ncbi:unnamed protein product [Chrysoparadoxa australica]